MPIEPQQEQLDRIVRASLERTSKQITYSLKQIAAGNPLGSERNDQRRVARLVRETHVDVRQAEALPQPVNAAGTKDFREGSTPLRRYALFTPKKSLAIARKQCIESELLVRIKSSR